MTMVLTTSETNAVPRSNDNVTIVTRQPSFSSPTRLATGTRTSSKNTSLNSVDPTSVRSGRISTPGRVHRQDQPADALVLGRVRVGADEQLAVVRDLGVRRPDLLAVDHVVVAVADGATAQRREVRAGVGLGEALAPDLLAAKDPRQVRLLLLGRRLGDERRAGVQQPDEVHPDVRRLRPLALLEEDEVLGGGRAAPAVLRRPVDAGVARRRRAAAASGCRRHAAPASPRGEAWAATRQRRPRASDASRCGTPAPRWCTGGPPAETSAVLTSRQIRVRARDLTIRAYSQGRCGPGCLGHVKGMLCLPTTVPTSPLIDR